MFIGNIRKEAPEFKRCCFCLPLRRGLIAWGYAKVGFNIWMIIYNAFILYWIASNSLRSLDAQYIVIFSIIIVCFITDTIFHIIFIVAGHMKSIKLLKVSYVYNNVWLGLLILGSCFMLYVNLNVIYRNWSHVEYREYLIIDVLLSSGLTVSIILVQIYVILLIRSEMTKLQNQTLEMEFTNHAASDEPHCTLHNASGTGQCTDKKRIVQYSCTDEESEEIGPVVY